MDTLTDGSTIYHNETTKLHEHMQKFNYTRLKTRLDRANLNTS